MAPAARPLERGGLALADKERVDGHWFGNLPTTTLPPIDTPASQLPNARVLPPFCCRGGEGFFAGHFNFSSSAFIASATRSHAFIVASHVCARI